MTDLPELDELSDDLLEQDIAILGQKGAGKSYTAKGIVERQLAAGSRVCIIDPMGIWWALRTAADGKGDGFPVVVFGGEHGDIPLRKEDAKRVGELVAKRHIQCVIDTSELGSKRAQLDFMAPFLEALRRHNRQALSLVLEEADVFAPQNPMEKGNGIVTLGHIDEIARRGRAHGFRLITLCQRPAKLHKDVLTQLSTLICMRITGAQDRKAVEDWLKGAEDSPGQARQVSSQLASFPTGTGFVWSPERAVFGLMHFPPILTLDNSATPKQGEKAMELRKVTDVDIEALRKAMEDKPKGDGAKKKEEAKASQKSVTAALEHERKKAYDSGASDGYAQGWNEGYQQAYREIEETFGLAQTMLAQAMGEFDAAIGAVESKALGKQAKPPAKGLMRAAVEAAAPKVIARTKAAITRAVDGELGAGPMRWLESVCGMDPLRMSWAQHGTIIGRKTAGGAFNGAKRALLDGGYLEERDGLLHPTAEAFKATGKEPSSMSGQRPIDVFLPVLPAMARAILEVLAQHAGECSDEMVAAAIERQPTGGAWNTAMRTLRDNRLIERSAKYSKAAPWIFEVQ